uniref:hypothetical protein n=1 Tax=Microbacterium maritypicum TaxID=33918 RepID=UPI0035A0CF2A
MCGVRLRGVRLRGIRLRGVRLCGICLRRSRLSERRLCAVGRIPVALRHHDVLRHLAGRRCRGDGP